MSTDGLERFQEAFRELSSGNPISGFKYSDKVMLWSLWGHYLRLRERPHSYTEFAESLHKLANEAEQFRLRICELSEKPQAEAFLQLCPAMPTLVRDLGLFSLCAGAVSAPYGKPGHKSKLARTRLLVKVSVFIKLKTGHYNDGYLAEFIQNTKGIDEEDLSEEMLARVRSRFRQDYPEEYKQITRDLQDFFEKVAHFSERLNILQKHCVIPPQDGRSSFS